MSNRFGNLAELYNRNHLTNAICGIMNDINNNFTIRTLKEKFINRQEGLIRAGLVGRKDIQNEESLIYLFNTKSIDNIYYIDDYVYFVNGNKLQVYSNAIGLRDLVQYKELEFNKNLSFSVYSK